MNNKILAVLSGLISNSILKVFSFTAFSTFVKMITGLISVKVVSVLIGPSGVALLGQLNNFITITLSFATGGINHGITKYVSEYKESDDFIRSFLSTALKIVLFCSFIVGIFSIIFSDYLSRVVLKSQDYKYVFLIFGFTVFLYALNIMYISILNGFKEFKKYVLVNIVGSIAGLIFTLFFVYLMGVKGALISAVTSQSVVFFVTFWMTRKLPWNSLFFFSNKLDKEVVKKYLNYSLMALVTAITVPVSQMFLRGYVISEISLVEAGWWEAMNRISNMYLMVFTSSLGVYYLPRLSELKEKTLLRTEILNAYKLIIPFLIVIFIVMYFLRFFIIRILFTPDFFSMESLFVWQSIGDLFKISSWLLAFLIVAKSKTKAYVLTEIIFSLSYVLLGLLFININGIVGITQAYALNIFVYFITIFLIVRPIIK